MNNYNAVQEVLAGLQSSALFRLKQTWKSVSERCLDTYLELQRDVSREMGYCRLRRLHRDMHPTGIPSHGVHFTDLTFISDGNSDFLNGGFCVNFFKCQRAAEVMRELERPRSERYSFEAMPHVQRFLETAPAWDEERCYEQSLRFEEWKGRAK